VRLGFSGKRWGFGLFSHEDRKAALDALKDVGATDLAHRSLGVLSGGELQKIFLAEALVSKPTLLLFDETLANLDMRRERELLQLINRVVRSRNATALLIAHNINPLLPYLDKVVYIANGKVATGTPKEVLTSATLSALFGVRVEILRDSMGNIAIAGIGDYHGCHGCQPE
jgi:zinc/manganese transport system ATP-binding protein